MRANPGLAGRKSRGNPSPPAATSGHHTCSPECTCATLLLQSNTVHEDLDLQGVLPSDMVSLSNAISHKQSQHNIDLLLVHIHLKGAHSGLRWFHEQSPWMKMHSSVMRPCDLTHGPSLWLLCGCWGPAVTWSILAHVPWVWTS